MKIFDDAVQRPDLFLWAGTIDPVVLSAWIIEHRFDIPDQLFQFWATTGGGDLYETETILGPFGNDELGNEVLEVNMRARERGLNAGYLLFHTGIALSAVRMEDRRIVLLADPDYVVIGEFASFDQWYVATLRNEYAARYGLE